MVTPTQRPEARQEFGTAKGWRIFIYLLAPPLAIAFLLTPFFIWDSQQPGFTAVLSAAMLGMAVFFIYGLLETYKAKHIITADSLLYEGAFRRKVIPLANLKGYRIDQQYTRFYSADPADPTIRIGYTSENYAAMQQWFAERYPDLDQLDQAAATEQLLQNSHLGASTEDRAATLHTAQRTAWYLNGAGGGLAVWLFFLPEVHYRWAVMLALAVPLLAIGALYWHAGVLRPDEKKNSAHPSLMVALLLPGVMLSLRALLDFELLDSAPLWPWATGVAAVVALAIAGGSWHFVRRNDGRVSALLTALLCAVSYGYGATAVYNCAFDEGRPTRYQAEVLSQRISTGRSVTYYLALGAWGPSPATEVTVGADLYRRKHPGSTVHVYLGKGRLNVPWFEVGD